MTKEQTSEALREAYDYRRVLGERANETAEKLRRNDAKIAALEARLAE